MQQHASQRLTGGPSAHLDALSLALACVGFAVGLAVFSATSQASEPKVGESLATAETSLPTRKVGTVAIPSDRAPSSTDTKAKSGADTADTSSKMTMAQFLDRLMMAESSGRATAKNPLSTATGAFQFIESTWISVLERHFPKAIEGKSRPEILALRFDPDLSRKAAEAYTRDNAAILASDGHAPTFPNLRLAFLLGAGGASRVLAMEPNAPIAPVLGRAVMAANPFMRGMTAQDLVARAARDLSLEPTALAGIEGDKSRLRKNRRQGPRINIRCNLRLASCRRWLALKKRQLRNRATRRAARKRSARTR
jgi:hypothetical protein